MTTNVSHRALLLLDGAGAVLFAGILALLHLGQAGPVHGAVASLTIVAMSFPLAVRRIWPVAVFTVVFAASVFALLAGVLHEPFTAAALALYTVELRPRSPAFGVGLASATGVLLAFGLVTGSAVPVDGRMETALTGVVVLGMTWTLGWAVRERREQATRAAEQFAAAAVSEERLRIARELHDVVTSSMGLIAVKAGVANHVLAVRPEEAYDALQVIERTSRQALLEMRRMVGVLRTEPLPLTRLAEDARAAGVDVDLVVTGELPAELARPVFRIVQESLTNVVRHAAPAHCQVSVRADADEVIVEITDNGPGPAGNKAAGLGDRPGLGDYSVPGRRPSSGGGHGSGGHGSGGHGSGGHGSGGHGSGGHGNGGHGDNSDSGNSDSCGRGEDNSTGIGGQIDHGRDAGGHGLIGMRERVTAHGGEFTAGQGEDGGFRICVRLPIHAVHRSRPGHLGSALPRTTVQPRPTAQPSTTAQPKSTAHPKSPR